MQIKKNIPSSLRTRSAYLSTQTFPRHFEIHFPLQFHDALHWSKPRKPDSCNCGKHNFTTRKASFLFFKLTANDDALASPEQPSVPSAHSGRAETDSVLNIPRVVLNEELCISLSRTERERLNVRQIIHRDYKSQRCQCFQWCERMLPRSLIQMTRKTTAAAIKRSAIKKGKKDK